MIILLTFEKEIDEIEVHFSNERSPKVRQSHSISIEESFGKKEKEDLPMLTSLLFLISIFSRFSQLLKEKLPIVSFEDEIDENERIPLHSLNAECLIRIMPEGTEKSPEKL